MVDPQSTKSCKAFEDAGNCNDNNPCTIESCNLGACKFTPAVNGTACGTNKVCLNSVCVGK